MSLASDIQQKYQNGERQFSEENLAHQNFSYQTLDACDFSGANLTHTNLSFVSFKSVNFQNADLSYAICTNANFTDADLSGAILIAANLSNAIFIDAVYDDHTQFPEGFDPKSVGAINQSLTTETEATVIQSPASDTGTDPLETRVQEINADPQDEQEDIDAESESNAFLPVADISPDQPRDRTEQPAHTSVHTVEPISPIPPEETDTTLQVEAETPARPEMQDKTQAPEIPQEAASNTAVENAPTALVSPAPETPKPPTAQEKQAQEKKKKPWLILLTIVTMPVMGGLAFLGYDTYQTHQTQRAFLTTINQYRNDKDYESCLQEITVAESKASKTTPFLDFKGQLVILKDSCTDSLASNYLTEGLQLKRQEQFEEAIALLSKIPTSTPSYQTAKEQIQEAGENYCTALEKDAKKAADDNQFQTLIDKGQNVPTQEAIADDCQQRMANLQNKWDENIPAQIEAEKLLAQGDCQRGQRVANSLSKSVFQKWQQTAKKLIRDVKTCETPLDISTTLQANSTHTFKAVVGQNIKIDLRSRDFDPVVTLLDANGNEIAKDDDGGSGNNALLTQQLKRSGEFKIQVSAYKGGSGTYALKVTR